MGMSIINRNQELSNDYIDLSDVLSFTLNEIELREIFPDLIIVLELGYKRDGEDIAAMCKKINVDGYDTLIAVSREKKSIWVEKDGEIKLVTDAPRPAILKETNAYISRSGYCLVTHALNIRNNDIYDSNIGLYCLEGSK
jgi:hypothetical protein